VRGNNILAGVAVQAEESALHDDAGLGGGYARWRWLVSRGSDGPPVHQRGRSERGWVAQGAFWMGPVGGAGGMD